MPGRRLTGCRARARSPKLWPPGCSIPRLCTRCRRRGWLTRCTPRALRASRPAYFRWALFCRLSTAIRRSGVRGLASLGLVLVDPPGQLVQRPGYHRPPRGRPSPPRRQQTKPKPSVPPCSTYRAPYSVIQAPTLIPNLGPPSRPASSDGPDIHPPTSANTRSWLPCSSVLIAYPCRHATRCIGQHSAIQSFYRAI